MARFLRYCIRVAFIPFICAGDPDLETTSAALRKLDEIGADVIELGVPYSVGSSNRTSVVPSGTAHSCPCLDLRRHPCYGAPFPYNFGALAGVRLR